jgi:rod shape determining protein RodA
VRKAPLRPFDLALFLPAIALLAIGILFIYSSGVNSRGALVSREFLRQMIWAFTGIGILLFFSFFDYGTLRVFSLYIYGANILLLILTLIVGREVNGARSWLGIPALGIQPSEFMKISTILFIATYLTGIGNGIRELPRFLLGLLIAFLPMALILLQPDMGGALPFIPIFLLMAFIGGAEVRHLLFILFVGIFAFVFTAIPTLQAKTGTGGASLMTLLADADISKYLLLASAAVAGLSFLGWRSFRMRYFFWISWAAAGFTIAMLASIGLRGVLREYQIMRLVIFVNPRLDPQGAGWNVIQSVNAIGSGGLYGKGFLRGTQSTDFIFSILGEEWGFLGTLLVFALFLILILRGLSIVWNVREDYATLCGTGLLSMFFFHLFVNIGMATGIMPVTGIPLLFLSYGGSSLWTALISVGILMNMSRRRAR